MGVGYPMLPPKTRYAAPQSADHSIEILSQDGADVDVLFTRTRAFSESMSTSAREQMCHEFGVEKKVDVNKHPLGIPCGLASSMAVFPGRPTVWGVLFWRFEDAIKVAVESISKVLNVVSQKAFLD